MNQIRQRIDRQKRQIILAERNAKFNLIRKELLAYNESGVNEENQAMRLIRKSMVTNQLLSEIRDNKLLQRLQIRADSLTETTTSVDMQFLLTLCSNMLLDQLSIDQREHIVRIIMQTMPYTHDHTLLANTCKCLTGSLHLIEERLQERAEEVFLLSVRRIVGVCSLTNGIMLDVLYSLTEFLNAQPEYLQDISGKIMRNRRNIVEIIRVCLNHEPFLREGVLKWYELILRNVDFSTFYTLFSEIDISLPSGVLMPDTIQIVLTYLENYQKSNLLDLRKVISMLVGDRDQLHAYGVKLLAQTQSPSLEPYIPTMIDYCSDALSRSVSTIHIEIMIILGQNEGSLRYFRSIGGESLCQDVLRRAKEEVQWQLAMHLSFMLQLQE